MKAAGKRLGDALTSGMEEALKRAVRLRDQLDRTMAPDARQAQFESKERAHAQRLTEIRERADAQQVTSAAKAASQVGVIAEKTSAQRSVIEARGAEQRLTIAERSHAQNETLQKRASAQLITIEERKNAQIAVLQARADADAEKTHQRAIARQKSFGDQLTNIGTALTAAVTVPLALVAKEVLSIGLEYEKSLNTFGAVTRATAAEMAAASAVAKQLGADVSLPATSAADAAKAMTELAKGGLDAKQAMDAARGTLLLAAAAQIEEAKAAEITANALNAFKLQASDAAKVADLLAAASNASSAEITDFAQALQQSSASAAALKIPIGDTITALGLLANAGIKGSDAGTSLKTALLALNPNTDKAAAAMKALGVNAFDAQGKLLPLREVVGQFSGAFAGLTDQQKIQAAQTIFGTDAMRAALIVFGGGVDQFDKLSDAVNKSGAAQELAAAKTKGLGGAYESLKSQLETGAIIAFERLKGPLESVTKFAAEGLTKLIDFVEKLAKNNPALLDVALAFTGLAAVVGPVTLAIAAVVAALGTLGAPALAVVAVITGVAATIGAAWATNFLGIRDVTLKVFGEVSGFVREQLGVVVNFFRENLPIIKEAVANVLGAIRAFWKENGDSITTIVKETWEIIKTIVTTGIKIILDVIKLAAQLINGDWSGAWETFKGIVSRAIDAVAKIMQSLENRVVAGLKLVVSAVFQVGTAIKGALLALGTNIVLGIIEGIKTKAGEFASAIKGVVTSGINAAKSALGIKSPSTVFYGIGLDVGQGFVLGIEAKREAAQNAIKSLVSPVQLPNVPSGEKLKLIPGGYENILDFKPPDIFGTLTDDALEAVPAFTQATSAIEQFGSATQQVRREISPLETAFSNLFDKFAGFVSGGLDKITKRLGVFGSFAKDILGGIANNILGGLKTGIFGAGGAAGGSSSGGGIGGFLGKLLGINSGPSSALSSGAASGSAGSLQSLLGGGGNSVFTGLGLGGLTAPTSITSGTGGVGGILNAVTGNQSGGLGALFQKGGFSNLFKSGGLLSGIGFGKAPGSGGALASALPLLGLSLGSQLGGGGLGSIIGGAGGALLGIGATAAPGIFAAGGALANPAIAALFSNPITAIIGGALLAGAFFIGRAKARKRDEATSGDYLQQAIDNIRDLVEQVKTDQIPGEEARKLFESEVMATFIAQINTIKTKSVRESRLTNQTSGAPWKSSTRLTGAKVGQFAKLSYDAGGRTFKAFH